jgi:vancomycin resistance protein VanJ
VKILRLLGTLLVGAGSLAAWLAFAGAIEPRLDPLASFLPLFGGMTLLGLLCQWRPPVWALVAAVIGVVPVAIVVAPELMRAIPAAPEAGEEARILTHNVWRDNTDPAGTAQAIVDAQPDVVLLQEVDGSFRPMLAALRQHFPHATDCPPGCELAIFSRWPIVARDYFLKDARGRSFGPPLLWARIAPRGQRPFTVATLHYPWPASPRQAERRRAMARALARIDRGPLIVAGDMNLTPWAAAMREQDRAFAPLTRMTRALASWRARLPLLPIDQLYAGPDWGLIEARRLPATGSDHYPLLIALGRR